MDGNPVRGAVEAFVNDGGLDVVTIDETAVDALAATLANEEMNVPTWDTLAIPDPAEVGVETVFDVLVIANSLNFQFDHYHTGETFTTTYDGATYTGAYGLFACFTRALAAGTPVTSPAYLATLDRSTVTHLLQGDPPMPRLPDRHRILCHIGTRLQRLDSDSLFEAVPGTPPYPAFDGGDGVVEWLVRTMPAAYNDRRTTAGRTLPFFKKAQLVVALLAGRLGRDHPDGVTGLETLTLFADYVIPAVLRHHDVLSYTSAVADRIDTGRVLPVGSRAEVEVRAATITAGERLLETLDDAVTPVHLDHYLWGTGRRDELAFHRTPTTSY